MNTHVWVYSYLQDKELFTTILSDCVSSPAGRDVGAVAPCMHEEADTRIFLHVAAAASAGHRRVIIRTSDSDVVVLAVSNFVAFKDSIDELWIAFGMQRHFKFVQFQIYSQVSLVIIVVRLLDHHKADV